jgi:hypothetical protein
MAQQSWWQRMVAAINATYERRIRAASLVTEYGADHHDHTMDHGSDKAHHHETDHSLPAEAEEDDAVVIANVPRGTRLARVSHQDTQDTPPTG